jgi:hypothetical protein
MSAAGSRVVVVVARGKVINQTCQHIFILIIGDNRGGLWDIVT